MLAAIVIAIPLGVIAATRKGQATDGLARAFAVAGQGMPPFWLGLILILLFAVKLRWLPAGGTGSWRHLVLPTITLGWFISAGIMRLLRGSMLEVLRSDFVLFARSYGMSERRVVWTWALPNGLISVVTFIGYMFGVIIAGAIVVESVFAWPGLGRLAQEAVVARDVPLIQGTVLVLATLMILSNLLVDLAYGLIDPRVRTTGKAPT
jgi:peptide/nickel transport system permease protein